MGKPQREWAARVRESIFDLLGRECQWCGAREQLSFDCIVPTREGHKADHHRRYDLSWRMSFYRRQLLAGNLQVLCLRCNSSKGDAITYHETELPSCELPPVIAFPGMPF